jgi:ribosome biogenesis GTPase
MLDLNQLGWKPFFQTQLSADEWEMYSPARIAMIHRSHCVVWSDQDEHELQIARFKNPKNLAVGDWVALPHSHRETVRLLQRENELARQAPGGRAQTQLIGANVDTLLIVSSCNDDFAESRIERFMALAAQTGIRPVIVLTKADLTDQTQDFIQAARALDPDIQIECVDARDPDDLTGLHPLFPVGQTTALIGASGVGKSTLINNLADADQATFEVSTFDGKGQHTTTARSLHPVPDGGLLLDTPGMRELQLTACERGINAIFPDVVQHFDQCRYTNCLHQSDAGCAIHEAIDAGTLDAARWKRYQQLQLEQARYLETLAVREKKTRRPRRR